MSKARELSKLLSGTLKVGALQAPAGTTAQRPSGQVGQIRYNSETGKNETYDSGGWGAIATPPLITTVSPSTYNGESGTQFTINGSFFDVGASVKFIDNAGIEYTAATITRNNAAQLLATTPQDFTVAQEPLKVKVLNPSGLNYTLDAAIDCGGVPTWNTAAGNLATVIEDEAISSIQLSAGDPDVGTTISYVLQNGNNLPTGLVLSSAGLITGTPNVNDAYSTGVTHNFTVNAMDNAGNVTPRLFNIIRKWRDGSTASLAAVSANYIKSLTNTTVDGTYWLKPTNGSGTAFQAFCIMSKYGGGWVKFLQWFGGTDMNSASAINSGGTWCNAEINGAAGKLSNADIWAIQAAGTNNAFLMRVGGGSDNLFNNGAGTGKFQLTSSTLTNWGTDVDPTATYTLSLDTLSNDSWDYSAQYSNDHQGRCGHTSGGSKLWYSNHNYNGTFTATPPYASIPHCFSIEQYGLITNLHWMSGQASQSNGEIQWGTSAGGYASLFIK